MCRRLVCPATGSRRARVLLEETCQPTALHLHARREETNDHHLAECPKPYLSQDVPWLACKTIDRGALHYWRKMIDRASSSCACKKLTVPRQGKLMERGPEGRCRPERHVQYGVSLSCRRAAASFFLSFFLFRESTLLVRIYNCWC